MKFNNKPAHIVIISMIVFIVLNIIENLIYYNGGKYGLNNTIGTYFTIPKPRELIKLLLIMIIFAFAQGVMTDIFSRFY